MKAAVFAGRFALLTRAHLTTATEILKRWPQLLVAVLDLDVTPEPPGELVQKFPEFYELSRENCNAEANPFTVDERVQLWHAALQHTRLSDHADAVRAVRPELDPAWFNRHFPPGLYDLVTVAPTASCSRFDHIRTGVFSQILTRPVIEIAPPIIEHTSDALTQIASGAEWASFLAPGTANAFNAIDGPQRMQGRLARAVARSGDLDKPERPV